MAKAILGGGCFWCTESVFQKLKGVQSVVSGYAGGSVENPTYDMICTGTTGHAEVIAIEHDEEVISFADILNVFFVVHDPTTLNRQGADTGTQYRSVIFYLDDEQRSVAEELIATLEKEKVFADPIVTEVSPAPVFYPAEEYHQDFYNKNPTQGYCVASIEPKLKKLRERHQSLLA